MCHYPDVASAKGVLDRLKELREQKQRHIPYSASWLAKEIGVDRSLLYRWLSGDRPMDPDRRLQIAALLGMDPADVGPVEPESRAA